MKMLIFLFLLCAVSGCSPETKGNSSLLFRPGDGVGSVRFGDTKSTVEKTLGKPDSIQGTMAVYQNRGLSVSFSKEGVVNGFLITAGFQGEVAPGFPVMNMTRQNILERFGPSASGRAEANETLQYPAIGLTFNLQNGHVHHIVLRQIK